MFLRKKATWKKKSLIEYSEDLIPKIGPNEAILKVESCAICGSDVRIFHHGNPRVSSGQIIGHEISGVIHSIGKNIKKFALGDRVSLGADVPCGKCRYCKSGNPNCCEVNFAIGHQFEGGFTSYMLLNELTLLEGPIQKISDHTDFDLAALAEPLACCINGFEHCNFDRLRVDSIAIFGAGPIGLMLAMLGSYIYSIEKIYLFDIDSKKRDFASKVLPNVKIEDPKNIKKIIDLDPTFGFDIVFTAAPSIHAQNDALKIANKRGYVNFFGGLPKDSDPIKCDSNHIHYNEIYVTGSHGSTPLQHKKAVEMIESNFLPLEKLITHKLPLHDLDKGYKLIESGEAVKVIIKPNN